MNPHEYIEATMKMVKDAVKDIGLVDVPTDKDRELKEDKWFTEEELHKNREPLNLSNEGKAMWQKWYETSHSDRQRVWKKLVGLDNVAPEMNQAEKDVEIEAMKKAE